LRQSKAPLENSLLTQNKAKLSKILIITLVFEKNANFFAENWGKSQKIVIITSVHGHPVRRSPLPKNFFGAIAIECIFHCVTNVENFPFSCQGCQISIGKTYQNWKNIPKDRKLYQMTTKYTKGSKNIPKGHKIYEMDIKYSKNSFKMLEMANILYS
jgi:hypothetical protein